MNNGATVAAWILILVGIANIAYGVYRTVNGAEDSMVLFGTGVMSAGLGAVLLVRTKQQD